MDKNTELGNFELNDNKDSSIDKDFSVTHSSRDDFTDIFGNIPNFPAGGKKTSSAGQSNVKFDNFPDDEDFMIPLLDPEQPHSFAKHEGEVLQLGPDDEIRDEVIELGPPNIIEEEAPQPEPLAEAVKAEMPDIDIADLGISDLLSDEDE